MAVFGEESAVLNIFEGMAGTLSSVIAKDKCNAVQNLILTRDKEYTLRDDLVAIQEITKTASAVPTAMFNPPVNMFQGDVEVFTASGTSGTNSPSLLVCYDNGTTRDVTWLNYNDVVATQTTQTLSVAARGIKAFVQYKGRYYASNYTSTIFRVSNFSTTGGATLTVNDLISIAGVNIMVAFKNRIFGIAKNRIYYTDLPAVGGYPETWNTTVNFFDMPSIDFDITIYNAIVYKDKMYLFTDRGVYFFAANGDVLNWSVQLISSTYCVYNKSSACLNAGILFMTDQKAVYAFNGSSFIIITKDIQEYFNEAGNYTVFSIFAYDDGIALCRNMNYVLGANYSYFWNSASTLQDEFFYYNMSIWVSIKGATDNVGVHGMINFVKAGVGLAPYKGKTPASYIVYVSSISSPYQITTMFIDKGRWAGDNYTLSHLNSSNRRRKSFQLMAPSNFLYEKRQIKIKKFILYMIWYDSNPVSFNARRWDGQAGTSLVYTSADISGVPAEYVVNCSAGSIQYNQGSFVTHRACLYVNGTMGINADGIDYIPPLVIFGAEVIYNSDNRQITERVNG